MGSTRARAAIWAFLSLVGLGAGCGGAPEAPPAEEQAEGLGILEVSGTGRESYALRDAAGNHITSVQSNSKKELAPGKYSIVLGNRADVVVKSGETTSFALGLLSVDGTGRESYALREAAGKHVTSVQSNTEKELVPGDYSVVLGNRADVVVKGGEKTSFALGMLSVSGAGRESYALRDAAGNQITSVQSSTEKELVPGDYSVVLGNRADVVVKGGEETSFALGPLSVSGTGRESYALRDAAGNHITSVQSSTEKELVPGDYSIVLGNRADVVVKGGESTSFGLGQLAVSGTGRESYALRDAAGNHITSVLSNTEKELVPGDYSIVLGNRADVVVKGGETTSFALGVLVVGATGGGSIGLADVAGNHITSIEAGMEKELVPGRYILQIGESKTEVEVAAGKTTTQP